MKYQANPVIVEAYKITDVTRSNMTVESVELDNVLFKYPSPEMLARINPMIGDYWVIQEDGYEYMNPKDVFERKYSPIVGAE